MKKIPTMFIRNPENMSELLDECHPDCMWVFKGEGTATRKYDGTCCKIENGELWRRREMKGGKPTPANFIEEQLDQNTGKRVGWIKVKENEPNDRYHILALQGAFESGQDLIDGTYELLGQKIQGNPEGCEVYILWPHADAQVFDDCPRDFNGLKLWLEGKDIEGVVFHHQDGRMAKIKKRDFGLKR